MEWSQCVGHMGYSGHRVTMSCSNEREVPAVDVFDREGPWSEEAYRALPADGRVELVDGTLLIGPGATPGRERAAQCLREALAAALPEGLKVIGPVPIRLGPDCVLVPDLVVTRDEQPEPASDAEEPTEDEPEAKPAEEPEPAGEDAAPAEKEQAEEEGQSEKAVQPEKAPEQEKPAPPEENEHAEPEVIEAADALLVVELVGREHGAADRTFKPQIYARSRIPYSLLVDYDCPFALASMIIGGRYHEYAYSEGTERFWLDEPFRLEIDLTTLARQEALPATG